MVMCKKRKRENNHASLRQSNNKLNDIKSESFRNNSLNESNIKEQENKEQVRQTGFLRITI